MLRASLLTILLIILFTALPAANIHYVGSSTGVSYWHTPSNWSGGNVPTPADDVTIDCDCYMIITSNYSAFAKTVEIGEDTQLRLSNTGELLVAPDGQTDGIKVDGHLTNYGSVTIGSANNQLNVGIQVSLGGTVNNQGELEIFNFYQGVRNRGMFQTTGELLIGQATYAGVQEIGLLNFTGSTFINHGSGGDLRVAGTNEYAILNYGSSVFKNYGSIRVENSVTGRGVVNIGNMLNRGSVRIYGADNVGFRNEGLLNNEGLLRFYNSGVGDALQNQFGELINHSSGTIYIWGNSFTAGIRLYGNSNTPIENYGRIDLYIGSAASDAIYMHSGSVFNNHGSGEIEVDTYAPHAFRLVGSTFTNDGGEVELNTYGSTKKALEIGNSGEFINENCGRLRLEDNFEIQAGGQLINDNAWIELSFSATPVMFSSATFFNAGFVHDLLYALENVNVDNDYGVVMHAMEDYLYPGVAYQNPLMVGPYTNVQISEDFYGSANSNTSMGDYDQQSNTMTPDPNSFSYEKYYYFDFAMNGCGTRRYQMYSQGAPPAPLTHPGNTTVQQTTAQLSLGSDGIAVYPNPVMGEINLILPVQPTTETLRLELRSITGQSIMSQTVETAGGTLSLNRPVATPAGTYLLTVVNAAGEVESIRVVFQ